MQLKITVDGEEIQLALNETQVQGLAATAAAEGEKSLPQFLVNRVLGVLTSYGQQAQEKLIEELKAAFLAAPPEKQAEYAKALKDAQAAGFVDAPAGPQ